MSEIFHNPNLNYRRDIDGLRAIAILLVVIFHAFPKFLRGGFIGVDIFFVISGYLITTIILKNQSQNNFSLLDFYSRRIKRIFPALIVVLTFCLISGWYILLENEYQLLGKHVAAGAIYISNFILQSESGYFDVDSELKPLLHLWSLAIEEQFYLVFPLLLILGKRFQVNALHIILACFGISFLLNVFLITDKPTEVFFFPYSRAWELLVGSLLAYLHLHIQIKPRRENVANSFAWFGVLLILIAWIFLDSKKIAFPSWWALMPTVGAACLIFAGELAWFNRKILASKFAVFIGLISYPLYLWHWILLSFARITEIDKPNTLLRLGLVFTSMLFAWLTYQFVEKNVRFQKSKLVSPVLLGCVFTIGAAGYVVKQQNGYSGRFSASDLIMGEKAVFRNKECVDKYITNAHEKIAKNEFCMVQNSQLPPTAILIGDSHAHHIYHGLVNNTALTGGNLLNRGLGGCFPFIDTSPMPDKNCPWVMNEFFDMALSNSSIATVIVTGRAISEINEKLYIPNNSLSEYFELQKQTVDNNPYVLFENGMRKTLQRLTDAQKRIVFILDVPELEFNPRACLNRPWRLIGESSAKTPCAVPRTQVDLRRKKYLEIVKFVLSEFPNVQVLDPLPALCDDNFCWATKENKMLYIDEHHLSVEGAVYVGQHF